MREAIFILRPSATPAMVKTRRAQDFGDYADRRKKNTPSAIARL